MRYLLLTALLVVSAALAQSVSPAQAQLTPPDVKKLETVKARILIPTFIPKGFNFKKVEVTLDKRFGNSYEISYVGPKNAKFSVSMASGGIGDMPGGDQQVPFDSPVFGKGQLEVYTKENRANTGWLAEKKGGMPVYQADMTGLSSPDAVMVAQGLRFLK